MVSDTELPVADFANNMHKHQIKYKHYILSPGMLTLKWQELRLEYMK